jgi:hypothetical protein
MPFILLPELRLKAQALGATLVSHNLREGARIEGWAPSPLPRIQAEGSGNTPSTSNCPRWKCHTLLSSRHRKATSTAWLSTCTST